MKKYKVIKKSWGAMTPKERTLFIRSFNHGIDGDVPWFYSPNAKENDSIDYHCGGIHLFQRKGVLWLRPKPFALSNRVVCVIERMVDEPPKGENYRGFILERQGAQGDWWAFKDGVAKYDAMTKRELKQYINRVVA